MKKTLIALMALAGVATAADADGWTLVNLYEPDTAYILKQGTGGTALTFDTEALSGGKGFISEKTNGNTSPDKGKLEMDFVLTNTDITATLVSVSSDSASQAGWGVTLKEGSLYFGQLTVNSGNTTSAMHSYNANCTLLSEVETGVNYSLTLISWNTTTGNTLAGRGSDNFEIILTSETASEALYHGRVAGFGLNSNGEGLTNIELGGSNKTAETAEFGSVSRVAVYIPEPATATLSLLALCGLAARRRRS